MAPFPVSLAMKTSTPALLRPLEPAAELPEQTALYPNTSEAHEAISIHKWLWFSRADVSTTTQNSRLYNSLVWILAERNQETPTENDCVNRRRGPRQRTQDTSFRDWTGVTLKCVPAQRLIDRNGLTGQTPS